MGFRSTFTTLDLAVRWPVWFVEKYRKLVVFSPNRTGALSAIHAAKVYDHLADLEKDIQKAIDWTKCVSQFVLVWLHDCGGITRCEITKDAILLTEPTEWDCPDEITHYQYACYGCSDAKNVQ